MIKLFTAAYKPTYLFIYFLLLFLLHVFCEHIKIFYGIPCAFMQSCTYNVLARPFTRGGPATRKFHKSTCATRKFHESTCATRKFGRRAAATLWKKKNYNEGNSRACLQCFQPKYFSADYFKNAYLYVYNICFMAVA